MSLDRWQAHLHGHFSALRAIRKDNAVFALEHSLSEEELSDLFQAIHKQSVSGSPSARHWLPWAVYSAEIGYEYSGEEYWQTFAERTPGWAGYGDRNFIREIFKRFHREMGGPYPRGRWAEAFRIICWPITNSILPRDLQRELAEILYDLRDHYTFDLLQETAALGEKIDAFSWRANSRFQHFADQHDLVGQIAAALLRDTKNSDSSLILPSTLRRIAADLERGRRAREWLTSAQTSAARLALRGMSRGYDDDEDRDDDEVGSGEKAERRRTVVDLGIEPEMFLVRAPRNLWEIHVRLPDLSRLLGRFPQFKQVLTGERCTVKGAKGAPLARGFLLYGSQEVVLASWPGPEEVLLKFENSTSELDFLLTTECLLRPGPRWLFKILGDGTAMEVKGRVMRPGSEYIVLSEGRDGSEFNTLHSQSIDVQCEGLTAVRLEVPETVSAIYKEQLSELGFRSAGTLRVHPVGLAAASWDNEGYAEWLTSDSPLLTIKADHELKGMVLNLVGPSGSRLEISHPTASPLYVELGELLPGRYKLHMITQVAGPSGADVIGTLNFGIRHPRGSQSMAGGSNPFRVLVSPAAPSLEQLWSGEARLEMLGPQGRRAQAKLEFFLEERQSQRPPVEKVLPAVDLPCTSDDWQESLGSVQGDPRVQNAYGEAVRCRLHIDCEELGYFSLDCEREFTPTRWILKHENNGYWLRLAQYESSDVLVTYFPYETPTRFSVLSLPGGAGFKVPPEGGLYLAKTGNFLCSVFVPGQITSLSDLDHRVETSVSLNSDADVGQFLTILNAWADASNPGDPISRMRKEKVVSLLRRRLLSHFCGGDWVRIEQKLQEAPSVLWDLRFAISTKAYRARIGTELFDRQPELAGMNTADLSAFLSTFVHRELDLPLFAKNSSAQPMSQLWIMELAYRLMSCPEGVVMWASTNFAPGLAYLRTNAILLRIARYVFLLRNARIVPKVRRIEERKG